jgi:hypothetical protein
MGDRSAWASQKRIGGDMTAFRWAARSGFGGQCHDGTAEVPSKRRIVYISLGGNTYHEVSTDDIEDQISSHRPSSGTARL